MPTRHASEEATADELHLLQVAFDQFHASGEWPRVADLQVGLDRAKDGLDVVAVGERLDPGLGSVQGAQGDVTLTLHGIARCAGGSEELADTLAAVRYGYQRYLEEGVGARIKSHVIGQLFGLSDLASAA